MSGVFSQTTDWASVGPLSVGRLQNPPPNFAAFWATVQGRNRNVVSPPVLSKYMTPPPVAGGVNRTPGLVRQQGAMTDLRLRELERTALAEGDEAAIDRLAARA